MRAQLSDANEPRDCMMPSITRNPRRPTKNSDSEYSEKCSTKLSLLARLYWRPAFGAAHGSCKKDAFGLAYDEPKTWKALQNSSMEIDDLVKSDKTYHQPWNSYDCHRPDSFSLAVFDPFVAPSPETCTKPTHLRRRMSFHACRAAISDMLKKRLAIFSMHETMSVFFGDCQGLQSFPTSTSSKRLPNCYSLANPSQLIGLVSDAVIELMNKNAVTAPDKCKPTRFHSKLVPHISVYEYIERLSQLAEVSSLTLLTVLIYVRKILSLQPAFRLSSLTVHRLLLSCVAVGVKVHNDCLCSKKLYARAGGVRPDELTILELELLKQLAWEVIPREEYVKDCYLGLVDRNGGYVLPRRPEDVL
jgi:hypothetical protein